METLRSNGRARLAGWLIASLLALGVGPVWGNDPAAGKALSGADMVAQATKQSAAQHRIEQLPDGRVRVPSPMQAIEAEVSPAGVTFRSTARDEPGTFSLRAASLGRAGGASGPINAGVVSVESGMARITHANLIEELTTSAEGVRQDFLVPTAPVGAGALELTLELAGAAPALRGDALVLTLPKGRELLYHQLKVTDSRARELPARFEVDGDRRVRIAVEDSGAAYPIRIDPTVTDADWTSIVIAQTDNTNGTVRALVWDGSSLYVGGEFTTIAGVSANRVARWNGSHWSALGSGTNNGVLALAWDGSHLYAGGWFNSAGGVSANRIAKWDGNAWSAVGGGMDGDVHALAWDGTYLYAGGWFGNAGGVSASRIAKWDGGAWSALGSGMSSVVWSVASDGTYLYAGGEFTTAGGVDASRIARWNGSAWSAVGGGMNDSVLALAWDGVDLYAGGRFTTAGGIEANRIAKWNGSDWSALGSGMNDGVLSLAVDGNGLYAGGHFTTAGGTSANHVARWDGGSWSALGSGMNSEVLSLVSDGTNLYAGGTFSTAGGMNANRIAKWEAGGWAPLWRGMNGNVQALASDGSNLYAGGSFTTAGGVPAARVARWDGSRWSALGSGVNGDVRALAWDGSTLYAGGTFSMAGGATALYVARWDGTTWSAVGSGMNNAVEALAINGTDLYVGGWFTTAGGISANRIAKWNGSAWSALGTGVNGAVRAMLVDGSDLYAGGDFGTAGGTSAYYIAKWDGGIWSALGSGMNGQVYALAADDDNLYAGGYFTTAGGLSASRVARWSGGAWSSLGSGLNNGVLALASDGTNLYAGGWFTAADGASATRIAMWDGGNWSAMGSGANSSVRALLFDRRDRLYAGGDFTLMAGYSARVAYAAVPLEIASVTAPASGTYRREEFFDVVFRFSRAVTVTGAPRLAINVGGLTRHADYQGGSGTTVLTFRYRPLTGDADLDGVVLASPLELNGGAVEDKWGNDADLTFTVPDTSGVLVVGNIAPSAVAETVLTNGAAALDIDVTANDSDADGDTLTVSALPATTANGGTLTNHGGYVTYAGATGWSGTDSFSYTVSDGYGGTASASVTVHAYPRLGIKDGSGADLSDVTVPRTLGLTPSGGSGSYTVTAAPNGSGVSGTLVQNEDGSYSFTRPTTGAFAGYYVVTATDNVTGASYQVTIAVPPRIEISRPDLLGIGGTAAVEVRGAPAGAALALGVVDVSGNDVGGILATVNATATATDDEAHANPAPATLSALNPAVDAPVRVRVTHPDLPTGSSRSVIVVAAEIFSGTVTDGAAAMAGATVVAEGRRDGLNTLYKARTDDVGRFSLAAPTVTTELVAAAVNHGAQATAAADCRGDAHPCTLALGAPGSDVLIARYDDMSVTDVAKRRVLKGFSGAPVVVAGVPSHNGNNPGVARVANVDASGFDLRFAEWSAQDGDHRPETIGVLALAPGRYSLPDGSVWEVGTFSASGTGAFKGVSFSAPFLGVPRLFLTVQTENESDVVAVRAKAVSREGFRAALFEEEARMNGHAAETVGYVAVYNPVEAGQLDIRGTPVDYDLAGAWIGSGFAEAMGGFYELKMQEETSLDSETSHVREPIDLLLLGTSLFGQDVAFRGNNTAGLRYR